MIIEALEASFLVLAGLMAIYLVRHYVFTITVLRHSLKSKEEEDDYNHVLFQPSVTVLIPARNEERVIGRILRRMTELDYPREKLQVIAIDDASNDKTGEIIDAYARTCAFIVALHRNKDEGGRGKASALNAAMKLARGEIVFCLDADYYPRRDLISRLVGKFVDPRIGAVQGRVTVANEPESVVTRLVALERIGGYRVDQLARNELGLIPQFGGTVGGVRRQLLESSGGWDEFVLAEDTELTFRIRLAGYRIWYDNSAECYEEAVATWRAYWHQRSRWSKGHMQVAFKYWLEVVRSKKLSLREKADGLLLLDVYFMPILVLFSWVIGISLLALNSISWSNDLWFLVPLSIYSFAGNFAPLFEVGIGVYLDGRKRAQWLIPFLIFTFLFNIMICSKAFIDVLVAKMRKKSLLSWDMTAHVGNVKVKRG